jgi:large subunit ribosomal protein L5|uniref:Large ribosomal subunit protein uL5c n=1 Tax=Scherffelia dubia TaxID=3190 RepID=A0A142BY89_SCHDU|nr:ribosomal protein L5 [Scherffelia dubia]AMP43381.1 ribosomal protein L5 [Scherffelia dubia]
MPERLKDLYLKEIVPKLMLKFQYKNKHEVPRLEKIVINRGIGEASQNTKIVDYSLQELTMITGQKPIVTRSKKSIAGFKLRENMPVGISVTLRHDQMYGFLDRFINLALPRIRDFQGINAQSLDKQGNYTIGLEEQLMFPEVDYEKIDKIRGLDISIITSSKTKLEGFLLLKEFGMPFKNKESFEKTLTKEIEK